MVGKRAVEWVVVEVDRAVGWTQESMLKSVGILGVGRGQVCWWMSYSAVECLRGFVGNFVTTSLFLGYLVDLSRKRGIKYSTVFHFFILLPFATAVFSTYPLPIPTCTESLFQPSYLPSPSHLSTILPYFSSYISPYFPLPLYFSS